MRPSVLLVSLLSGLGLASPVVDIAAREAEEEAQFRNRWANETNVYMVQPVDHHGVAIAWALTKKAVAPAVVTIATASAMAVLVHTIVFWGHTKSDNNDCKPDIATVSQDHTVTKTHQITITPTTTGSNCKTTAQEKTMQTAVSQAIDLAAQEKLTHACITLWHRGTWFARVTVTPTGRTAETVETFCPPFTGKFDSSPTMAPPEKYHTKSW